MNFVFTDPKNPAFEVITKYKIKKLLRDAEDILNALKEEDNFVLYHTAIMDFVLKMGKIDDIELLKSNRISYVKYDVPK